MLGNENNIDSIKNHQLYDRPILAKDIKEGNENLLFPGIQDIEDPDRPETPEYKAHDEYIRQKMDEYDRMHPEPPFNPIATIGANMEHDQWLMDRAQYREALENTYRAENPEYARQAEEYDKLLFRKSLFL